MSDGEFRERILCAGAEMSPLAKFRMAVFESENMISGVGLWVNASAIAASSATCGCRVGMVRVARGGDDNE